MWRTARPSARPYPSWSTRVRRAGAGASAGRVRRLLDEPRWQPVPRLPGNGALPDVPVRRNRPVGGRALPDAPGGPAPGDHRQVVGRLRGDGGAHAPTGPLRGAGHPCRRRPVRGWPTSPTSARRPRPSRALRRVVRAVLGRLPVASGRAEAERSRPAEHVVHGRVLLDRSDGTVRIPFDPATGRLVLEVWDRWLARDPVRMVPGHADALRGLSGIWIDAGSSDEWFLDLGAAAFQSALAAIGSPSRSSTSSCSKAPTPTSSIGTRWLSVGSRTRISP